MTEPPMQDPVTVEVLSEAISNRVVHRECPFCESREWFDNGDRVWLLVPHVKRNLRWIPVDDVPDPAVGFVCKGCGFVRLHLPAMETSE